MRSHPEFQLAEALIDPGVSAYSGRNRQRGALGGFLSAAQADRVPPGSVLVVEDRAGDHELVKAVDEALQTPEAARVLRNAVWLQVDLKGSGARPSRTIGTVVRSLGGITEAKKVGPRGAQ